MPSHPPPPTRPITMLPKFIADTTTTTIIYCIHCRSCSSSCSGSDCNSDEAETPTENTNNNQLNRCSRCKMVHYCSKECQKLNYQFHKKRCQLIYKLRNEIIIIEKMKKNEENVEIEVEEVEVEVDAEEDKHQIQQIDQNQQLQLRYELSYLIFELGYMSTDTIERGKYIYQCSLIEYYKLLQIDFYATGVFESILLLLSILDDRNYDKYCISLIKYVLSNNDNDNNNDNNEQKIYHDNELLCWDYGDITTTTSTFEISDYKNFRNLLAIHHHRNNHNSKNMNPNTNPNILLVPLMIIKMRQYADIMTNSKIHTHTHTHTHNRQQSMMQLLNLKKEIAEICYQIEIEYETNSLSDNERLPVMKSLFPDSNQHWGEKEAQMLLANKSRKVTTETTTMTTVNNKNDNDNEWNKCCFLYWMLIKDCYAYTPGLLDAVEDIIIYMEYLKSEEECIPNDVISNNDNDNDPSESSDNSNNQSIHNSEEYISFINSMSSTAQEQQHKQQQEEEEEENEDCRKKEEDYH